MTKRKLLVGAVALLVIGALAYGKWFSPVVRVQRVADRFIMAITRGDMEQVQALVAHDAKVSAAQWIAKARGTIPPRGTPVVQPAPDNPCGIEMMATSVLSLPDGTPQGLTLLFKRVEGQWLVYQGDGKWCSP